MSCFSQFSSDHVHYKKNPAGFVIVCYTINAAKLADSRLLKFATCSSAGTSGGNVCLINLILCVGVLQVDLILTITLKVLELCCAPPQDHHRRSSYSHQSPRYLSNSYKCTPPPTPTILPPTQQPDIFAKYLHTSHLQTRYSSGTNKLLARYF